MNASPEDLFFEPQRLRQEGDMDCGVPVFGALANLSREEILVDIPDAGNGKTVDEWTKYLREKGFEVSRYDADEEYPLPCAHLVQGLHWVYQAKNGGVHDPSSVFAHTSPMWINIDRDYGGRILSISVTPVKGW